MKRPLEIGASWKDWEVEQVLSWGHRGGQYLLHRPGRESPKRTLTQLLVPEGLTSQERTLRTGELQLAVAGWQALKLPQTVTVEEITVSPTEVFLLQQELPLDPLSVSAAILASERPDQPRLALWAEQIVALVLALQRHDNPLALGVLDPDKIVVDSQNNLAVFDPGWDAILWDGVEALRRRTLREALRQYGELLILLGTGAAYEGSVPTDLDPSLVWVVGRCLSDNPSGGYLNFEEVRNSLKQLPTLVEQTANQKALTARFTLEEFIVPRAPAPPREPDKVTALGTVAVLSFCLLGFSFHKQIAVPHGPATLALARESKVELLTEEGLKSGEIDLRAPIRSMVASTDGKKLFVVVEKSESITILDSSGGAARSLKLPETPERLQTVAGGEELLATLPSGRFCRISLKGPKERVSDTLKMAPGSIGGTVVPKDNPVPGPGRLLRDEDALFVAPKSGVYLQDGESGVAKSDWAHPGASSVVAASHKVLVSEGKSLHILDSTLSPESTLPMPGAADGACQLYVNSYRRSFWSVGLGGSVGIWNLPKVGLAVEVNLPTRPRCVTTDSQGHLWALCADKNLVVIDSKDGKMEHKALVDPTGVVSLARIDFPEVRR